MKHKRLVIALAAAVAAVVVVEVLLHPIKALAEHTREDNLHRKFRASRKR